MLATLANGLFRFVPRKPVLKYFIHINAKSNWNFLIEHKWFWIKAIILIQLERFSSSFPKSVVVSIVVIIKYIAGVSDLGGVLWFYFISNDKYSDVECNGTQ